MKTFCRLIALLLLGIFAVSATADDYTRYNHIQWKWPTGSGPVDKKQYAVPVYFGLPERPYIVLGYMRAKAAPVRGNSLIRYEAQKAKELGGDALIANAEAVPSTRVSDVPPKKLGASSGDRFATWWGNAFPSFPGPQLWLSSLSKHARFNLSAKHYDFAECVFA